MNDPDVDAEPENAAAASGPSFVVDDPPSRFVPAGNFTEAGLHALAMMRGEALMLVSVYGEDEVLTGWTMRPESFDLTGYGVEASLPAPRLSFLAFMDLFTDDEQFAIAGAAMTDVATKLWYDRAVGAQYIALDDPRLAAGLQALVDAGLISALRRDRVLQALPPNA